MLLNLILKINYKVKMYIINFKMKIIKYKYIYFHHLDKKFILKLFQIIM